MISSSLKKTSPAGELLREYARSWQTSRQLERLKDNPHSSLETVEFAVIGDAEPGRFWIFRKLFSQPAIFSKHLGSLRARPLDFIIQLGDMVSRGTVENYLSFFQILSETPPQTPYLTVIGNHDRSRPNGDFKSGSADKARWTFSNRAREFNPIFKIMNAVILADN